MFPISYCVLPTILFLILVRKYRESKWGKCKNTVKLDGKIAIVTGANSGIGLEIAKELAGRNAQVILACRDLDKANQACEIIRTALSNASKALLVPMELDLASLYSIRDFCNRIKRRYKEINILINNAGVVFPNTKRVETKDGFEVHFGVNHLGHFYLTNLLLEQLSTLSGKKGRIVVVASSLHEKGEVNPNDLNALRASKKSNLYANSKLMNVYFAQELARRTEKRNVNVYACCPGWVYTGLFRHSVKWYHYFLITPVAFFFMRSPKQGAQTPVYCATEPDLENETGLLYRDCTHYNSRVIFYDNVASKLWEESENVINSVIKKE
ncbi:hypothetical protein NQ315_001122 [Exocentrus adspersus]|uniref:Retinol dehydrogenase 11 n=1 Tax=Exocentrus adspersus TaxID=1586481 RepID=A0AAV8WF30_9CUCU|nr:hypothetical protein NQ315_001122 [Exocentrus adspersus]